MGVGLPAHPRRKRKFESQSAGGAELGPSKAGARVRAKYHLGFILSFSFFFDDSESTSCHGGYVVYKRQPACRG